MKLTIFDVFKSTLPVVLNRIALEAKYFFKEDELIMTEKLSALREWEILKAINDADAVERELMLREWGNQSPINYILSLNFNSQMTLDLPEGVPPYKRDEATHTDFQGALVHQIKKLRNCFPDMKIPKIKKERTFMDILESIPPKSADIVLAMKEKSLTELYPNITRELVSKIFPNFVK